ncbi:hypothetical protein CBS147343_3011 [Aspergillus niger]|uniref:Uncharacterized protein n=1 Tax=Aspergillus niger TaxID=5061 RepID=A0A3F3RTA7_ASPNG|nr:hypothetical protein CBS12448_7034 [Aspergillus niger]KAI2915311.1 hypothetical protein CBS147371_5867 [Aspergillus niger]KAI2918734.1 hypothetical protein CBS147320_8842 [Aspergillus niger]KAI2934769.1 hypothetical protein CBS147321_9190 [Aspergillus niger]KAI2938703.1 hypothetical protein CBS147322_10502 [Aspergillus niger]
MPSSPPPGTLALDGRDLVLQPLPDLQVGPGSTRSGAIHDIHYKGQLAPWPNFINEVENAFRLFPWATSVVDVQEPLPAHPHSLSYEQVYIGDEHAVQGRFSQLIGQAMGGIFASQGMDIRFGDFKSCTVEKQYKKVPDVMMRDAAGAPLAVGEEKTPWAKPHDIRLAMGRECILRHLFGQPAMYMRDLDLQFGFLSTYEQTVFFRQDDTVGNNQTVLLYSPVIMHNWGYIPGQTVTLKQALFYLGLQASAAPYFITSESRTTGWVTNKDGDKL